MTSSTVHLTVPDDAEGSRLDRFLSEQVQGRTRSFLQRLIREGLVQVDGRAAPKPGLGLRAGMRVEIEIPTSPPDRPMPEMIPVEVSHEDEHLLVVNKPAGLVVHPGHGRRTGTLVNALMGRATPLAPAGGRDRPGIVHRLDRETSGLLVVAKTDVVHLALSRSFARREVEKKYRALVWGHPDPPEGSVERRIGRSRADPTRMSVGVTRGRYALTRYRTVEPLPGFAMLEIDIETGRTHQIRVHLQSLHHPVVGDSRYGGRCWKAVQDPIRRKALREFIRLALHASELAFRHPVTEENLRFRAELPQEFRDLVSVLRNNSR